MTEKKILFITSGSFESGFGHIRRSVTLADEISDFLNADNISFYCDCPDDSAQDLLSSYKCALNEKSIDGITDFIRSHDITTLIIDDPADNTDLIVHVKKKLPDREVICLDYFNYSSPSVNTIINLFNHNNNITTPGKTFSGNYYEGLKYAIIRDSFMPYIKKNRHTAPDVEKVLITFGGADIAGNTMKALRILEDIGYSRHVDVIAGPFFRNKSELARFISGKKFTCSVQHNIDNLEEYIYGADLAFINPGTTMMESCSIGIPVLVFPESERAYRFARIFEAAEAIKLLNHEKPDLSSIKDMFKNYELKVHMSKRAKELIDGKGKTRIRDIVLDNAS